MTRGAAQRALRWPLWSWRNLAVSTVVVLALLALLGRLTDAGAPAAAGSAPAAVEQRDAPAPTAAAVVPTPAPTATASSSAPTSSDRGGAASSPVKAATGFVAAWASTSHGEDAWLAGMTPWATPELLASLKGTDPAQVPASRITGDAALRSTTGPTAVVSVPTDGGRIHVTLKQNRGTWAAAALAPDDAPPAAPTPSLNPARSGSAPTGSGG